jgi:hypothetical protein
MTSKPILRPPLTGLSRWLFFWLFVKPYQTVLKNGYSPRAIKEPEPFCYWEPKHEKNKLLSTPSIRHTIIFHEITVSATVSS